MKGREITVLLYESGISVFWFIFLEYANNFNFNNKVFKKIFVLEKIILYISYKTNKY